MRGDDESDAERKEEGESSESDRFEMGTHDKASTLQLDLPLDLPRPDSAAGGKHPREHSSHYLEHSLLNGAARVDSESRQDTPSSSRPGGESTVAQFVRAAKLVAGPPVAMSRRIVFSAWNRAASSPTELPKIGILVLLVGVPSTLCLVLYFLIRRALRACMGCMRQLVQSFCCSSGCGRGRQVQRREYTSVTTLADDDGDDAGSDEEAGELNGVAGQGTRAETFAHAGDGSDDALSDVIAPSRSTPTFLTAGRREEGLESPALCSVVDDSAAVPSNDSGEPLQELAI